MSPEFLGTLILTYKYYFLIPAALIEGPMLMMLSGLWVRLGILEIGPTFAILTIAELSRDAVWYWIGYHWGHRFVGKFSKYFSITEEHIDAVSDIFHRFKAWIIIISKLTAGFGLAIPLIFTAGMSRIPFKQFMLYSAIGQIVWTSILMTIGYALGNAYVHVNGVLEKVSIVGLIIVIFFLLLGFGSYLRRKILHQKA